ncbi:MAG: hypothetical protein U1E29_18430 [Coriobacteriia bacterium]|nr:hypothetical protein [Coriobacteriia bacterium]
MSRSIVPILVLLVLLLLAAALWILAGLLSGPAVSTQDTEGSEGYRHLFSIYGSGADRLHRPTEIATDGSGNLYVADSFKHRIVVFDNSGAFIRAFGSPANVDGALNYPSSVAVDERGRVYVTSSKPDKVVVFDSQGVPVQAIDINEPLTLSVSSDRLYVATSSGILIGDLQGNQIGQMLSRGKEPGQIDRPTGMAIADDGTIYLADSLNYRFQAVDSQGESLWTLGAEIDAASAAVDRNRDYGLPAGLALGSDGVLYGLDAFNGEIVILSTEGEQLGLVGDWGRQDGQFYYPSGITQIGPERFAVADTFNDRVQIISIPSPRPDLGIVARRGLPWLAPLALLLLVLFLWRRPALVVTDAEGIRRAHGRQALPELMAAARVLYVPEGTAVRVADVIDTEELLIDSLREVALDDLAEGEDPAIGIALRMRGRFGLRRVALAFPGAEQAAAGESDGIGVLGETGPAEPNLTTT